MSLYIITVIVLLLAVFVPISLLPFLFSKQDYDSLAQVDENAS
jgi:hypothetical protein